MSEEIEGYDVASDMASNRKPNRKEAKQISFRLSEDEYEKLRQSAETLNMSVPAFVKKKAQGTRLVKPKLDLESRRTIVRDLSGIANNINQIAKYCNAHQDDADIERLNENVEQMRKEINAVWQQLN